MLFLRVPKDTPFSSRRVTLDGAEFILRLEWNMRGGWYIGLSDQAESVIFAPRKLVPNWDLLRYVTDSRRPRGQLYCLDMSGAGARPEYDSLGSTHQLVYIPAA